MNVEALIKLVCDLHTPDLYCHVLIDPMAMPDRSDHSLISQLGEALGEHGMNRVLRDDFAHAPHYHPVLASLSCPGAAPNLRLLAMTAHAAQRDSQRHNSYLCGWILSEAPGPVVAKHLAALCRLPTASDTTVFHPIYEPTRLELLATTFERLELGPWWPIKHWIFQSSGAKLAQIRGEPRSHNALPPAALRIQNDVPSIQALLVAWRAMLARPEALNPPPLPPFATVRASNLIDDARRTGLSATEDILAMALHHLCVHPRLHTLRTVRDLIEATVSQQRPLAPMLAGFSAANWRHMTANLPQAEVLQ